MSDIRKDGSRKNGNDTATFGAAPDQRSAGQAPGRAMFGGGPGGHGPGGMRGPAMMGMPAEKAKDVKGTLRRLGAYLAPSTPALIVVLVATIVSTAFSIVGPRIMGDATTLLFHGLVTARNGGAAASGFDYAPLAKMLVTLAGLYVVSAAFSYLQAWIMAGISQRVVKDLRRDAQAKLERLPLKYFDSRPHGDILSRMTNDIDTVSTTLQQTLAQVVSAAVTLVGVLVMMILISPVLTLIGIATLPLSIFVTMFVARHSRKHFSAQQRSLGELTGRVEETFGGFRVVKAFGREKATIAAFEQVNGELYKAGMMAQFISGLIMPLMNFVNNIGYVLVCVVGGVFAAKRTLEIGDIQAFIQYLRQFTQPIVQTANIANVIQSTIAAAERVFMLLDEEEEVPDLAVQGGDAVASSATLPSTTGMRRGAAPLGGTAQAAASSLRGPRREVQGAVRFEDVSFRYREDTPLIEHLDLDVEPGHVVAIVGPTGAGKTTLVNLLMRFYELNGGSITLDGTDIRSLPRGVLRRSFGMVLQDTWLFNGTVRDNIAYGKDGATEEEIVRAASAARADHFIRTLPEGYDTVLNEEASNISQGQKQLLTIARAVLADPPVLILDEATSSVDTRTELYIQHALIELMSARTSFVIAHRLSTIRDAQTIIVMDNGRIVEQGNHKELLAKGGAYAELYESQFAGKST